jgi:hypothetical protein
MGAWKTKLIFLLIVYLVGFATALYCITPVPENRTGLPGEEVLARSALISDEFAQSLSAGLHKGVDFTKVVIWRAGRFMKQRLNERK